MQPPPQLIAYNHWVAYRLIPSTKRPGKTDKIPISPLLGSNASTTDPSSWGSWQAAVDRAEFDGLAGVGFVFTDTPFAGIDLDACVDTDGVLDDAAQQIVNELNSYSELSPSGCGVHVIIEATLPPGRRRAGNIEMYDTGRFFTFTGNQIDGTPDDVMPRQVEIEALHARVFAKQPVTAGGPTQGGASPESSSGATGSPVSLPDSEVIRLLVGGMNADEIMRLYGGDWAGYASQSEADLALCSHLAFYTGKNVDQMDRLFRQSGLYRQKWDRKHGPATYGELTIQQAIDTAHNVYSSSGPSGNGTSQTISTGWHFYTLTDAYQPRAPAIHVVESLFELPSLNIVYGPPGCLKSFLLADLCCCVAGGVPWLSPLPNAKTPAARVVIPTACVWIDMDNGVKRSHERFDAIGRAYQLLPDTTPLHYVSMPDPWLTASNNAVFAMMTREFQRLDAHMIVIDNLGATLGTLDENSAEMAAVMGTFRRLAENTNSAIVLVHHQRKSYGGTKQRQGDNLRGHSSIEAALDLALMVEREPYADDITVRATKCRGADVQPFTARFSYQNKPNSQELEMVRFWGIETTLAPNSPAAIRQAVIEVLQNNGQCNQSHLWLEVKTLLGDEAPGRDRIISVITDMATTGTIREGQGTRGCKAYFV